MNAPVDVTNVRIETPRLLLRSFRESDVEDFYTYSSMDGVGQMAGWKPSASIEESRNVLNMFLREKKTLALVWKETATVIGSLGLEPIEEPLPLPESLQGREIGFVLSKDYWGPGTDAGSREGGHRFLFPDMAIRLFGLQPFYSESSVPPGGGKMRFFLP